MKKLLPLIFLFAWLGVKAQKPDFIRTPNGPFTIVDWNLKAKTFILPSYLLTARPVTQPTLGTIFLNSNSADPHLYVNNATVGTYNGIPFIPEVVPRNMTTPVTILTNGNALSIQGNLHFTEPNSVYFADIFFTPSNPNEFQISANGSSIFQSSLKGVDSVIVGNRFTNYLGLYGGINASGITSSLNSNITQNAWFHSLVLPKANGDTTVQVEVDYSPNSGSPVATFGTPTGGSGYTNGTYTNVPLTPPSTMGVFKPALLVNITVSGGSVTSVTLVNGGNNHHTGEVFSVLPANIGGTGSGFSITCASTGAYTGLTQRAIRVRGGSLELASSTTAYPSLIIPSGIGFSGTQSGSVWNNGTHLYFQLGGINYQLDQQLGVQSVFGRNGNAVAQAGDYNTSQVTESGNLYFTNARVLATPATGFSASPGTISPTDPLITVLNKLQGNINASVTGVSSFNTRGGAVVLTTADVNGVAPTVLGTVTSGSFPWANLSGTVPTFNQNTTGSAAKWTTPRNVNGVALDGTANITITANTPGTHTNGYGLTGSPFSGANQTWAVDTSRGKLVTTYGLIDTINAHGAVAGIGINNSLFATGTVAVDTAGSIVSKGYLSGYAYTKAQANIAFAEVATANTFLGVNTFSASVTASAGLAKGTIFTPTLTQAANNDALVGVDITPTIVPGSFTGAKIYGARVNVGSTTSGILSGLLVNDAATSASGSVLIGSVSGGGFSTPCMWFGANTTTASLSNFLFAYDNGSGGSIINAPTGLPVSLRINNITFAKLTSTGYFQSTPLDVPTSLSAINSTATATAAQVGTGAITSTSAAATSITLPTGTQIVTQLAATRGARFAFTVDNTAGANTVTIILGSGMTGLNSPTLTIPASASGVAKFEIYVVSSTAVTISRIY